ncbi:glycosyltransferase family 61 protein [Pelagibacterales bacterium SAG-MED13]|nr:glycosyltransferase family 61 protein [Pelagibacterales bacterium SAG-MED13]|tara:strand:- start:158 stop:1255 length:1098 start_codon:yes stop_codon:yes gene_type:complete
MIKKKIKLYYKNIISKTFEQIHGKVLFKKNTSSMIDIFTINDVFFRSFENKKYNIYKVKNVRIFTDNNENVAVIKNNILIPKLSFQQINGKFCNAKYNSVIKKGTPSVLKKFSGTILNLAQGSSGNNYFHFFFDIIPKIFLVRKKIRKKINFYYVSAPQSWQIKIFKHLGILEEKLIDSKKNPHISVDEVISVDHPWYRKGNFQYEVKKIPKWIIIVIRKIFLNKDKKFRCSNQIFLDRSNAKFNHCQIFKPLKVLKWLENNNFNIIKPERFPIEKQIYLFKKASIVIGAHGAAFTNIIFCRPGTKIIEIIPRDHPNKKCERISNILKLKYFRIITKKDNTDKKFPYRINLERKHFKTLSKVINL